MLSPLQKCRQIHRQHISELVDVLEWEMPNQKSILIFSKSMPSPHPFTAATHTTRATCNNQNSLISNKRKILISHTWAPSRLLLECVTCSWKTIKIDDNLPTFKITFDLKWKRGRTWHTKYYWPPFSEFDALKTHLASRLDSKYYFFSLLFQRLGYSFAPLIYIYNKTH